MAKGALAKENAERKAENAATLVRLGNERARYKMALIKTLELLGVTGSDADWLISKVRLCEINPNQIDEAIIELTKDITPCHS